MNPFVQDRLEQLPLDPGVYLMKDAKGIIIYIGKAKVLRNRVRSYFNGVSKSHRAAELLEPWVRDIDWIVTPTELDALLLEANLVQKHQPRYNVRLKDDKHFPYLMLTWTETYPRLKVVRKVRDDGNLYYGPYTQPRALRQVLDVLPKIFQIRECDLKLPLARDERPCLNAHIGRCDAPCASMTTPKIYRERMVQLQAFLQGQHGPVKAQLEESMRQASASWDFERAARLRDALSALETLTVKQSIDRLDDLTDRDHIAWQRAGDLACVVVLEYRQGQLLDRRDFTLLCPVEEEAELLQRVLLEHYITASSLPAELAVDSCEGEIAETFDLLAQFMSERRGRVCKWHTPKIGDKRKIVLMAKRNAQMLLLRAMEQKAKAESIDKSVAVLQRELGLKRAPRRIEGYDISHLGGTQTVASGVCFVDGKPAKQHYRRYKVETVQGIDDFASMREVLGRRFRRLLEEGTDEPDLILIDGGKGQLSAAYEMMQEAGLDLPMIGLAKREEEIFFPGQSAPLLLDKSSAALKLLQRVRDEAHRFALTFQRERRRSNVQTLQFLEDLPGLGEATLRKLRQTYGTHSQLAKASRLDLEALIGKQRTQIVWDALENQQGVSQGTTLVD
jgi:excinuclease ABC subunit C